ncbi:unnamed protein product [Sympodiomycopsis kandeliae]
MDRTLNKNYTRLLGHCQALRIATTCQQGIASRTKRLRKLHRWLSAEKWRVLYLCAGASFVLSLETKSTRRSMFEMARRPERGKARQMDQKAPQGP